MQKPIDLNKAKKDLEADYYLPMNRPIVEAADKLLEFAKKVGYSGEITTERHWQVFEYICRLWKDLYPDDFRTFYDKQQWYKNNQKNIYASNREQGGAQVRHIAEVPLKLYQMTRAVFPNQVFDKKFTLKLARRMPLFRWADKL